MRAFADISSTVKSPNVAQIVVLPASHHSTSRRRCGRVMSWGISFNGALVSRHSREQVRDILQSLRASGCLVRTASVVEG